MSSLFKKNGNDEKNLFVASGGEAEEDSQSAFFALYASLMILLMTFFIVIYSTTIFSQAKFAMAKDSLYKVFEKIGLNINREIVRLLDSTQGASKKSEERHRKLLVSIREIEEKLEKKFGGAKVELQRYETRIIIPQSRVFDGGGIDISADGDKILREVVKHIEGTKYVKITIASHYVSVVPAMKSYATVRNDWLVSFRRAEAVSDYFSQKGLDYEVLHALGYGDSHPVILDEEVTADNVGENSRVVIVVKAPQKSSGEDMKLVVSDGN